MGLIEMRDEIAVLTNEGELRSIRVDGSKCHANFGSLADRSCRPLLSRRIIKTAKCWMGWTQSDETTPNICFIEALDLRAG
jgi:hypothetical protein